MGLPEHGQVKWHRRLYTSGFLGLAAGFGLELYRLVLLDPIVGGAQSPPEWIAPARLLLIAGSLAVFAYASALEMVDDEHRDGLVTLVVLAQWATPATIYFAALLGVASPAGFLLLIAVGLHVFAGCFVAGSIARQRM